MYRYSYSYKYRYRHKYRCLYKLDETGPAIPRALNDHINIRILHYGSEARFKGDSSNFVLWDPYVYICGLMGPVVPFVWSALVCLSGLGKW